MLEFNRLKFLNDVEEFESQCQSMSRRRAEAVEVRTEIRRGKERLAAIELEREHASRRNSKKSLLKDYDDSITRLQTAISHRQEWLQELEKGLTAEAERNTALGTVVFNMRKLLESHNVPDPSKVPVA